jgi:hypothetical protein
MRLPPLRGRHSGSAPALPRRCGSRSRSDRPVQVTQNRDHPIKAFASAMQNISQPFVTNLQLFSLSRGSRGIGKVPMAPLWQRRRSGQLQTTPPHSCRGSTPVPTRPSARPRRPVGRRLTPRQPLDPAAFGLNRATSQSAGAAFRAAVVSDWFGRAVEVDNVLGHYTLRPCA